MKENHAELSRKDAESHGRVVGAAAVHICFDEREYNPASIEGSIHTFVVPPSPSRVAIISRVGVAALDDRRQGVAIGRIVIRGGTRKSEIPIDHPMLKHGFHACERLGTRMWRCLDGAAYLPVALLELGVHSPRLIEIHVYGMLPPYEIGCEVGHPKETKPVAMIAGS